MVKGCGAIFWEPKVVKIGRWGKQKVLTLSMAAEAGGGEDAGTWLFAVQGKGVIFSAFLNTKEAF